MLASTPLVFPTAVNSPGLFKLQPALKFVPGGKARAHLPQCAIPALEHEIHGSEFTSCHQTKNLQRFWHTIWAEL